MLLQSWTGTVTITWELVTSAESEAPIHTYRNGIWSLITPPPFGILVHLEVWEALGGEFIFKKLPKCSLKWTRSGDNQPTAFSSKKLKYLAYVLAIFIFKTVSFTQFYMHTKLDDQTKCGHFLWSALAFHWVGSHDLGRGHTLNLGNIYKNQLLYQLTPKTSQLLQIS